MTEQTSLKVNVLFESYKGKPHCCGHIRLMLPLNHPTIKNAFTLTSNFTYKNRDCDVVIGERLFVKDMRETLSFLSHIKQYRKCFIYTIDDNLLDLASFNKIYIPIIHSLASNAHGIIVSTEAMKKRFLQYNKNVHVVMNALDERVVAMKAPVYKNATQIKIGYMGTQTHDADFAIVNRALNTILNKYPLVRFELVGGVRMPYQLNLPQMRNLIIPHPDYPEFWKWMKSNIYWDIAIAPLIPNNFNTCKSDIKFLDYSAMGMAGIYSDIEPYSTVQHGKTGLVVGNSTEEWIDALEYLLNNPERRYEIAKNAQSYLADKRTLQHRAIDWKTAIETIYMDFRSNL